MSENLRNTSGGKQPITRHPLFPATVALWFGALFGLGSLAIAPEQLEALVTALGIDKLVAAAEPPLGATARILVALTMAGLGVVLGAFLGRKLGAPKVEPVMRRRHASAVTDAYKKPTFSFDLDEQELPATDGEEAADEIVVEAENKAQTAQKRRQLALTEDARKPDYHDRAPLPGTKANILDVAEFELEGFEAEKAEEAEDALSAERESAFDDRPDMARAIAIGDHGDDEFISGPPQGAQLFIAPENAAPQDQPDEIEALDSEPEFAAESADDDGGPDEEFFAEETSDEASFEEQAAAASADAPAETLGNRLFDAYSREFDAKPEEHQVFEEADAAEDTVSDTADAPVAKSGFPTLPLASEDEDEEEDDAQVASSPFNQPRPEPLFARPQAAEEEEVVADAEPMDEAPQADAADAIAATQSRIATAPLDELSPVELLERLALTIERRRERAAQAAEMQAAAAVAASVAAASEAEQQKIEQREFEQPEIDAREEEIETAQAAPAEEPEAIEAPAPAPAEPEAPAPALPRFTRTAEEPASHEAGIDAETAQPEIEPDNIAAQDEQDEIEPEAEDDFEPQFVPPPVSVPKALRPVALDDDFDDDDEDYLASFIPQRKIGSAKPIGMQQDSSDDAELAKEEEQALEDGYSSLLGLSRPVPEKQQFVRIDEPEPTSGEVEPVVVFPGQETRRTQASAAAENPQGQPGAGDQAAASDSAARPFDPPKPQNPEETERALRAALATLQRMSGAA